VKQDTKTYADVCWLSGKAHKLLLVSCWNFVELSTYLKLTMCLGFLLNGRF